MRECPIEFSSLGVDGTEGKRAIADASRRNHLGIVSCRENLICLLKILVSESRLDDTQATLTQQPDHSLAGDARQKCSVRNWSENYTFLRHENIRSSEFGDIAQHIAHDGIVEAAGLSFKKRARVVGIETASLGVDRHRLKSRPAIRRQRDRETLGRAHRRFVDRKARLRGLGVMRLNPRPLFFRPVHGANVECGIPVELLDAFPGQFDPGFRRDRRLEEEFFRGVVDTGAMQLEVWRYAFEKSSPIKDNRAKPRRMRARAHNSDIALVPIPLEIGPGLGPPAPDCQSTPPWLQRIGDRLSRWTSLVALNRGIDG